MRARILQWELREKCQRLLNILLTSAFFYWFDLCKYGLIGSSYKIELNLSIDYHLCVSNLFSFSLTVKNMRFRIWAQHFFPSNFEFSSRFIMNSSNNKATSHVFHHIRVEKDQVCMSTGMSLIISCWYL